MHSVCCISIAPSARQDRPAAPGQTPSTPQLTFRVETNFIEVDAVVTDGRGAFVRDLKREDFAVFEDGKPQKLDAFALIDIPLERVDRPLYREDAVDPDVFTNERDFSAVSEAIGRDAGVADISGYTDYGRVWTEFAQLVEDDLHPRATVIVLGDARTNGRDPRADIFASVTAKAGRTFWLNPEPRLYWNYGDSVIAAYEEYCQAFECWTTQQLEDFVKALTRPIHA